MELLAPAGNVENFHAALQAGADAVYIGAPDINARNLSRDLSFEEIWAMVDLAREKNKKVYLAANSLILEKDIDPLLTTLALLQTIGPDALIVQDLCLFQLVRKHFPDLVLHASTLMGACNGEAVRMFEAMGCRRVVLARELTLQEIIDINVVSNVDLEVFVHGAMCYSFSGLCLFSSYLGGKSGLRGRCVQPCRRGYTWKGPGSKKKSGASHGGGSYLFSMNDLEGFQAISSLKDAGIASLKIEGRLRSANYVGKIVEAYRIVIDAGPADKQQAVAKAEKLAAEAMGRKTSTGYFFSPQPQDAITPFHSGNTGLHLGSFSSICEENSQLLGELRLKYGITTGDRLRIHIEATGERKGFTLHGMQSDGHDIKTAEAGTTVKIELPREQEKILTSQVELFKLDHASASGVKAFSKKVLADYRDRITATKRKKKNSLIALQKLLSGHLPQADLAASSGRATGHGRKKGGRRSAGLELWLRTDSWKVATGRLPFNPDMYLLNIDKAMLSQSGHIKRFLGNRSRNVVWALPPVLFDKDIGRWKKQLRILVRSGFKNFQLGHISQQSLFGRERVHLYGDYTLNIANSQAIAAVAYSGLEAAQVSLELDRSALQDMLSGYKKLTEGERGFDPQRKIRLGLTVYGAPPLFTSRLGGKHFQYNKNLISPKDEEFFLKRSGGMVVTLPKKPFSLLPFLKELENIGIDYVIVDLAHMSGSEKEMSELGARISNNGKYGKLPTFNYLGKLE
ncbi:MAG: peptidase U32 family protein [Desulfopila sp.]|jgi:putative protease|nr:peptidase U32 family protein [Desulfopila sp.]